MDGSLACWSPSQTVGDPPPGAYSHVSVGGAETCAISETSGHVLCWGYDASASRTVILRPDQD